MNNLTDEEENDKNQIDKKPLRVEKPHLACLVAQHEQNSNANQEQKENGEKENNFEDDFDELMNSTRDQGE